MLRPIEISSMHNEAHAVNRVRYFVATKRQSSSTRPLISIIIASIIALALTITGVEASSTVDSTIDACSALKDQASPATITVQQHATQRVSFVDCALPPNLDISITVSPSPTQSADSPLLIELRNVVMEGGSLRIVPPSGADTTQPLLQDMLITVEDVALDGEGDVLVVDTRSINPNNPDVIDVDNVTISMTNAVITSKHGSVASFVTMAAQSDVAGVGKVRNVHVEVLGNTTVHTQGPVVASIVASSVVNASLVVDTSSCRGGVNMSAGDEDSNTNTGVLSIVLARVGHAVGVVAHLENIQILATTSSTPSDDIITAGCVAGTTGMSLVAQANAFTSVAVAGIALSHSHTMKVLMTGSINIDACFFSTGRRTTTASTPFQSSSGTDIFSFVAHTSRDHSAVATGGIAILVFSSNTKRSTTQTTLDACLLRISLLLFGRHELTATSKVVGSYSATTVFGMGVNIRGHINEMEAAFAISNSSVSILSSIFASTGSSVVLKSAISASVGTATTLGLAVNGHSTRSVAAYTTATINKNSHIVIAARVASPNAGSVVVEIASHIGGAPSSIAELSTTLGVSIAAFSPKTTRLRFLLRDGSTVTVAVTGSGRSLMVRSRTGYAGIANTLGVAAAIDDQGRSEDMTVELGDNCQISLNGLLTNGSVVEGAVANTGSSAYLFSVVGRSDRTPGNFFKVSSTARVSVWVGAASESAIRVLSPMPPVAVAVALDSKFDGLSDQNTDLSYCHDGTIQLIAKQKLTAPPAVAFSQSTDLVYPLPPSSTTPASACTLQAIQHDAFVKTAVAAVSWKILHGCVLGCNSLKRRTSTPSPSHVRSPSRSITRSTSTTILKTQSITRQPAPTLTKSFTPSRTASISDSTSTTAQHTTSVSQSRPLATNDTASPSPPPSPTPKPRRTTVVTSVMLPGNEDAATVVVSSAGASNAVVSTLGSGGAGVVVVAGAALRVMECGLSEDDPRPAAFELPIQFALGSSQVRYYSGAIVAHTVIQCALLAAAVLLRRRQRKATTSSKVVDVLAMCFCGTHAFFTATILGGASTVLSHSDGDPMDTVSGMGCSVVIVVIHGLVSVAVHSAPKNGVVAKASAPLLGTAAKLEFDMQSSSTSTTSSTRSSGSDSSSGSESDTDSTCSTSERSRKSFSTTTSSSRHHDNAPRFAFWRSGDATLGLLLTIFDGCRTFEKATHRHYSTVEITLASVVAVISGSRPSENCNAAAFVIGALALVGLLYVVAVRPFRTRLDFVFSVVNNMLLVALSVSVAVEMQRGDESASGGSSAAEKTMQGSLWLISIMAFVQLAAQGYWAYHVAQRRRRLLEMQEVEGALETPMLRVHTSRVREDKTRSFTSNVDSNSVDVPDDDRNVANPLTNNKKRETLLH